MLYAGQARIRPEKDICARFLCFALGFSMGVCTLAFTTLYFVRSI